MTKLGTYISAQKFYKIDPWFHEPFPFLSFAFFNILSISLYLYLASLSLPITNIDLHLHTVYLKHIQNFFLWKDWKIGKIYKGSGTTCAQFFFLLPSIFLLFYLNSTNMLQWASIRHAHSKIAKTDERKIKGKDLTIVIFKLKMYFPKNLNIGPSE